MWDSRLSEPLGSLVVERIIGRVEVVVCGAESYALIHSWKVSSSGCISGKEGGSWSAAAPSPGVGRSTSATRAVVSSAHVKNRRPEEVENTRILIVYPSRSPSAVAGGGAMERTLAAAGVPVNLKEVGSMQRMPPT